MRHLSIQCLFGTGTHLTALATKTTHALLAPLGTHTDGRLEREGQLVTLLDEGKILLEDSRSRVREADLGAGDKLDVLDEGLEGLDGGGGIDLVGRGSNEDLHVFTTTG